MDQTNLLDTGYLKLQVTNEQNLPVQNATITLSFTGDSENTFEQIKTNMNGQTENITLPTPPIEYSLNENNIREPYSQYNAYITASGYSPVNISGIQIFADNLSILPVILEQSPNSIIIPENTLYGDYPNKIPEDIIKPESETGEIVLSRVVIPETIIVHDGAPSDSTAKNYYVPYSDYIKNVASSEIYSTWPDSTITANILAIMSFTLNRVYTEWYRSKGYEFTITSSTAYDHKWSYGRNIYNNISQIVDEILDQYISRPNIVQPLLTQYCDGKKVTCPSWMSQWGSKYLGDIGYSPIEILRNYYGSSIYINEADFISGIPSSWPGYNLIIGSTGEKVTQLQNQLNTISKIYTSIPYNVVDGIYGSNTAAAVRAFQNIFGLPENGVADFKTWYKISNVFTGITKISELN